MVHPLINLGNFPIYNLMAGIGLIFAISIFNKNIEGYSISTRKKDNLQLIFIANFFIGIFFSNFVNWFVFPDTLKYPVIERFRSGGFSFYYGIISFFLFTTMSLKIFKYNIHDCINHLIPSITIFHAFGRIGCSLGGCCYGKIINLTCFNLLTINRFPARELESIFLFLLFYLFQYRIKNNRSIIYFYSYAIFRFFIEFGRGDNRGILITPLLSPAQLISITIITFCTLYLLSNKYIQKHHKIVIVGDSN